MTGRSDELNPEADTTGTETRNWAARHELALYFVLAYLISWAISPLVILNPTSSPLMVGLYVVVAIVVVLVGGRKQLATHIPRRGRQDSAVV
jgi:hypothetical protein